MFPTSGTCQGKGIPIRNIGLHFSNQLHTVNKNGRMVVKGYHLFYYKKDIISHLKYIHLVYTLVSLWNSLKHSQCAPISYFRIMNVSVYARQQMSTLKFNKSTSQTYLHEENVFRFHQVSFIKLRISPQCRIANELLWWFINKWAWFIAVIIITSIALFLSMLFCAWHQCKSSSQLYFMKWKVQIKRSMTKIG